MAELADSTPDRNRLADRSHLAERSRLGGTSVLLAAGTFVLFAGAPGIAAAAALLYRAVAFWLPTVVGGLLTVAFLLHPSER